MGVSLAVLALRLMQASSVYAIVPQIFDMKANSAVGFAATGAALLALAYDRRGSSVLLAVLPILIGALTLAEYFGVNPWLDELLIRDRFAGSSQYPGRAPPNTSAILVLAGAIFVILKVSRQGRARKLALLFLPLMIMAIAFETLVGHVGGSAFAVGWWTRQPMSIPSVICALALSAGIVAFGWRSEVKAITTLPVWVPIGAFLGLALLDVWTPLEVNVGICYIPVVLTALWFQRTYVTVAFAAIATLLIVLGLFASPPGRILFEVAAFNRVLAIASVWIAAALAHALQSERRRMRISNHHFAAAQAIAAIGSFELTFEKMVLRGSDSFLNMHGLPASEPESWLPILRKGMPPDEQEKMNEMMKATRNGQPTSRFEYSYLRPDGEVRNAVMHSDVLRDTEGLPVGMIGVVHDVTELHRARAREADIEGQLRHAQKIESLGMLAGSIAHDLNNTLVPITTLVPLLKDGAQDRDREIVDVVMAAARRAKGLVREMLVFSRKEGPGHEALRLDLLLRESLTIIRAGIPATIAIIDEIEPVPEILGSKGQLYQMILNLVTNAAHAIGDRPGTITIGTSCTVGDKEPDLVRFYLADDGAGMDQATADRIFEPFFSTKTAQEGTGLGLAIVSKIVREHGGTVSVQSAIGRGTRFNLAFQPYRTTEA